MVSSAGRLPTGSVSNSMEVTGSGEFIAESGTGSSPPGACVLSNCEVTEGSGKAKSMLESRYGWYPSCWAAIADRTQNSIVAKRTSAPARMNKSLSSLRQSMRLLTLCLACLVLVTLHFQTCALNPADFNRQKDECLRRLEPGAGIHSG
jgi:hypothetical protein